MALETKTKTNGRRNGRVVPPVRVNVLGGWRAYRLHQDVGVLLVIVFVVFLGMAMIWGLPDIRAVVEQTCGRVAPQQSLERNIAPLPLPPQALPEPPKIPDRSQGITELPLIPISAPDAGAVAE